MCVMSSMVVLSALLVVITSVFYIYLQWIWSYWNKQGVPQLKTKFPYGNFKDLLLTRKQIGLTFKDIYDSCKDEKFVGTYMITRAGILFRDLELIKTCLVKDFKHFHHRGFYDESERDPLAAHMFVLKGQRWKNTRAKLSPAFAVGKMKMALSIMLEAGLELGKCLDEPAGNDAAIDIKGYITRYITDATFSFIFGLERYSLSNSNEECHQLSKGITQRSFLRSFAQFLVSMFPSVSKLIPITTIDPKISKYFRQMFRRSWNHHESKALKRESFIHFLIQLKNKYAAAVANTEADETFIYQQENVKNKLSLNDLAAQTFLFLVAAFETSTSTIVFCLYELALNLAIQHQLQQEIDFVSSQHSGQITYEAISEMTYLDKVVSETLRKYPAVPILFREVTIPFIIPDTNVVLEKGTPVVIPVLAIHHDPRYYPEPERFDPERFSEQRKAKIPKYSYIPFGDGPRICIGKRYALIQIKLGLISILSHYNVDVSEKTQIPPVIDPVSFVPSPVGGMWLKISKRKETMYSK